MLNQYRRLLKEDADMYQCKDYTDECLNQYGWVLKEDTDEYQRLNTGGGLIQYGRVLKEDTDKYQKVKHIRVFE